MVAVGVDRGRSVRQPAVSFASPSPKRTTCFALSQLQRLVRLRGLLAKVSAEQREGLLSSEVLAQVGAQGHSRELALLLTYATPAAADAAAVKDHRCRELQEAYDCAPGSLAVAEPMALPSDEDGVVLVDASKAKVRNRNPLMRMVSSVTASCASLLLGPQPAGDEYRWSWPQCSCIGNDRYQSSSRTRIRPTNSLEEMYAPKGEPSDADVAAAEAAR